ncbi:MAG: endonuclease III [Actinomycetota bacterium]|nr:endonuclease III [Actinomycetota bacterium]
MPVGREGGRTERARAVIRRLARAYPEASIALAFSNPFELLVATMLSAQSTDIKVNEVTATLFSKYGRPEDFLAVSEDELKADIRPTGFFNQKARALRAMSQKLLESFDGEVPDTIAELVTLPGVARKTANIVQANAYPQVAKKDRDAGIAVDTHVGRLAVRLGLTDFGSKEADKIERDLLGLIAARDRLRATNLFIEHGRRICTAKRPLCGDCVVEPLCPSSQRAGLADRYRLARGNGKRHVR